MKDKNTKYVCISCKYATTSEYNMKYHEKTKKHKKNQETGYENFENNQDNISTFLNDIMKDNDKRRILIKQRIYIGETTEYT